VTRTWGEDDDLYQHTGTAEEPSRIVWPDLFTDQEWASLGAALRLSPRQREVARWTCRGAKRDAIATYLRLSGNTVRTHMRKLFQHLHVPGRVELLIRIVQTHRSLTAGAAHLG
jgi:DNA-binding CsgD family transcriptional regulator